MTVMKICGNQDKDAAYYFRSVFPMKSNFIILILLLHCVISSMAKPTLSFKAGHEIQKVKVKLDLLDFQSWVNFIEVVATHISLNGRSKEKRNRISKNHPMVEFDLELKLDYMLTATYKDQLNQSVTLFNTTISFDNTEVSIKL